ncbi:hypothetical protein [Homoserinibacter sp. YIM 151385]|uniref:hypothetical protein n=1 Tax=Homoserinibacter sp. YIM 151385 TaxID=2985506 RepID=UPI0022F05CCC|nr:hypothetical protein [Homoserinibacter sp. YIM 151385]WBU39189.1 hypothetical protein OF852_06330 [Homoserinibacter sp. YIM 151385]
MIIWSRWGILVLLFVGLGVLLGFLLANVVAAASGTTAAESGPGVGVFVGIGFVLSAGLLHLVARATIGRVIDKPRQATVVEKLAQPEPGPGGGMRTHRTVAVVHPETGQPVWIRPTSTFFFIPVRFWPFVLAGLGLVIAVVNGVALAAA